MSDTEQSSRNKSHTERPTLPPPEATADPSQPIAGELTAEQVMKAYTDTLGGNGHSFVMGHAMDLAEFFNARLQAAIQQAEINLLQEQDDAFSAGLSNPSTTPKQRDVMLTMISYIRIEKEERLLKQKGHSR